MKNIINTLNKLLAVAIILVSLNAFSVVLDPPLITISTNHVDATASTPVTISNRGDASFFGIGASNTTLCLSPVLLFFVTTSPCQEWVICAPAAFLGCGVNYYALIYVLEKATKNVYKELIFSPCVGYQQYKSWLWLQ